MRDIGKRLDRLEDVLGQRGCRCSDDAMRQVALVFVEADWDEKQIRDAEDAARISCPIHGLTQPVVRLSEADRRL